MLSHSERALGSTFRFLFRLGAKLAGLSLSNNLANGINTLQIDNIDLTAIKVERHNWH